MRPSYFAILAFAAVVAACGNTHEPTRQWEASGFQNPESAVPDVTAGVIYVSNVAGKPDGKDGNGFISKLSPDGKMITEKWITGLDAPKGLALYGGRLFVADIDKLVEIDIATGTIAARHEATGAKLLNDVAADDDGGVYVSDWPGNAIWRYADGTFEKWLESDKLLCPNGLLVENDRLIVAAWGAMEADFSTKIPGHLLAVSLTDKTISDLGDGKPVGNLDGLEAFDGDTYLVTDWVAGKVFQIDQSGKATQLLKLSQGSADLNYDPETRIAIIPMMVEGKVVAYKF
jgi:outer membrane protein assembly factor BamB